MELRFHVCGYPIRVWAANERAAEEAIFFDGASCWADRAIKICPGCGERLVCANLYQGAPKPAGTLAAYMLAWPIVRRQLEELVARSPNRDAAFAAAAEHDIVALECALNRVAELAARLQTGTPA